MPSLTETLFEIGVGESMVGVTNFCVFPPNSAPRLGGTKNPRIHAIRELQPDLVYVNIEENLAPHAEAIREFAPVFATHPKTVSDVVSLIEVLGEIHQRSAHADVLAAEIDNELARGHSQQFTFAVPIWKNPWMWCGGDTYVSDLVASVGGTNVFGAEQRYPAHPIDELVETNPDVIFLPDEPYVFTEGDAELLRNASAARVIGPFPGHLFTWHGARTLLGLRFLRTSL